jgi:hypothetical protein
MPGSRVHPGRSIRSSACSKGSQAPAPTATPPVDRLERRFRTSYHPTGNRAPAPTGARQGAPSGEMTRACIPPAAVLPHPLQRPQASSRSGQLTSPPVPRAPARLRPSQPLGRSEKVLELEDPRRDPAQRPRVPREREAEGKDGSGKHWNALPVRASEAREVGCSCTSTYWSKRSGNLSSRSSSGEKSSWSSSPPPAVRGGAGGAGSGAPPGAGEGIDDDMMAPCGGAPARYGRAARTVRLCTRVAGRALVVQALSAASRG